MQNRQQAASVLGWAGVIPFAVLAVAAWIGAPDWLFDLLRGYALLILAFMCGSLWDGALARPADPPLPLIISNVLILAALPALLLPLAWALLLLAGLFAIHGFAEWRWAHSLQPGWYRRLRFALSVSVVTLLILASVLRLSSG